MNKVLLVKKEKNYTSRDIVNIISKQFGLGKVGHFGTLDPLAEGLLVIGLGACTKIGNYLECDDKEYIAEVLVGTKTDTYDITGKILEEKEVNQINKEMLIKVLNSFKKEYLQEVPIYSAVKINGKKLYEYARNNEIVTLPRKKIEIKEIELIDVYTKEERLYFKFRTLVSKGTYIRSLINDISNEIKIPLTMSNLLRTKQANFSIDKAYTIEEIKSEKYTFLEVEDVLNCEIEKTNQELEKKVINGSLLKNDLKKKYKLFKKGNRNLALYGVYKKDPKKIKPYMYFN